MVKVYGSEKHKYFNFSTIWSFNVIKEYVRSVGLWVAGLSSVSPPVDGIICPEFPIQFAPIYLIFGRPDIIKIATLPTIIYNHQLSTYLLQQTALLNNCSNYNYTIWCFEWYSKLSLYQNQDLLILINWVNDDRLPKWQIEGSFGTKIAPWQVSTNTNEMPLKGNKSFHYKLYHGWWDIIIKIYGSTYNTVYIHERIYIIYILPIPHSFTLLE